MSLGTRKSVKKMTCHYFDEETGEFLYSKVDVPEDDDYCENCGDHLLEQTICRKGNHYWAKFI